MANELYAKIRMQPESEAVPHFYEGWRRTSD